MKVVNPKVIVPILEKKMLQRIERYGRVCYKSEDAITEDSYAPFLNMIQNRGHESMLEHEKITVIFTVDRGVSHEIVRHRIAAYSQESTRYCNYSGAKFGGEITVVDPFFFDKNSEEYKVWESCCRTAEVDYFRLINLKRSPQEARSILPNSLKTEIVVTYNLREWKHFFTLRCAKEAHPQMQQVAIPLLLHLKEKMPVIFGKIPYNVDFDSQFYAEIEESKLL